MFERVPIVPDPAPIALIDKPDAPHRNFRCAALANDIACPPRRVLLLVPAMNVHHLELFYYVARHGGISAAVRHIPYGIQQPAVSGQMRAPEDNLGGKTFARSPR